MHQHIGALATQYSKDVLAIGAFHAVKKGIVVVAAAGNAGTGPASVATVAPWIITVGATKMDREFVSYAKLGNGLSLRVSNYSKLSSFDLMLLCNVYNFQGFTLSGPIAKGQMKKVLSNY